MLPRKDSLTATFQVRDYDLSATFTSGQAFRWQRQGQSWVGVIGDRWVRLRIGEPLLVAEVPAPVPDWSWLERYLQLGVDLDEVLRTFPQDEPMRAAVAHCRGLRLLRQDPWECLASFVTSSTKQIVQIQQILSLLCERYGTPVAAGPESPPAFSFPSPLCVAELSEGELRACKMGFRAPFLLETARLIAQGRFKLDRIFGLSVDQARMELMQLPGVGPKIADCVLLFAYGFQSAFPVDVWIMKALREFYFRHRRVRLKRLRAFASTHFGPNAGYAQQYLFHYMRAGRGSGLFPADAPSR